MPILPSHKSSVAITKQFRDKLTQRTSISNFDRDSKARAMLEAITEEITSSREQITAVFIADKLSQAQGTDLDRIGLRMGKSRREALFGVASASENSIAFFVESGTFGTINGAAPITITAGTIIRSLPNNNEFGETIEYRVSADTVLPSGSTLSFAPARAVISGTAANIGANVLQQHNFTSYVDVANNSLKVVNYFPILNGMDRETDDQYRSRLTLAYASLLQNNESKIKLASLNVPGVLDVKVIDGYFGIGTAGVIVLGPESNSTITLVDAVQKRLDQFKGPGLVAIATPAVQVSLDLVLSVKTTRTLTPTEKTRLTAQIKRSITTNLVGVSINGTVDLDLIARQIQAVSSSLVSIQQSADQQSLFSAAYIRKGQSNGLPDLRQLLITTVLGLEEDEYVALGSLDVEYVA